MAAIKKLTPQQKRELMAAAQCNPRTVERWIQGLAMKATTKERLDGAWRSIKKKGKITD